MKKRWSPVRILLVIGVIFLVQLACSFGDSGSGADNAGGSDLAATEGALKKTQAALEVAAQQPELEQPQQPAVPTNTPVPPPPTNSPVPPPPTYTPVPALSQLAAYPEGQTVYFTDFNSTGSIEPGWSSFSIPSTLRYTVSMNNGFIRVEVPD